jgi:hypothetical protein
MPDVRYWGDVGTPEFLGTIIESTKQERCALGLREGESDRAFPPVALLALSGGGEDGAYGAGLLCGWTQAGGRPEFKYVTGISTGALIAPLAFLGPSYDPALREVYTGVSEKDIFIRRPLLQLLGSESATDTTPLRRLLDRHVTADMMRAVAAEHAKGRRLLIGTCNLDVQRPVVWDMGRIAARDSPEALKLFREVMIASASIPGVFPPVHLEVSVDGRRYEEMHVDGGTTSQVFLYPASLDINRLAEEFRLHRGRIAYVIRNTRATPDREAVPNRLFAIVSRAVSTLIKYQAFGDIYRIYSGCRRDRIEFRLAFVPPEFDRKAKEPFDREYMTALFEFGFRQARAGYPWKTAPPGLGE